MSEKRFNIESEDGEFYLRVESENYDRPLVVGLTLPELKALHERLGEVLWDVSAGRIKVEEK